MPLAAPSAPSAPSTSTPPGAHAADPPWRLRLLGAVEACRGGRLITHWPSRAAVALLARLALAPQRAHPREELVELLWPGVALDVGRNRLRQVLSTLKRILEADGPPVISADRHSLRLRPGAIECDALDFERLARAGATALARERYGGDLLPGHYDDWVLEARAHLAALHEQLGLPSIERQAAGADELPAAWTRLYGIEPTVSRLLDLVHRERLVTVVGPGGSGKTRLCLETARALRDSRDREGAPPPGGAGRYARIAFVPLVECRDAAQAMDAISRALHLGGRDPLLQLRAALAGLPTLLVLDNYEQLATTAAGLPQALLEAAPALRLLVSSRVRLGLPGEQVFRLDGLPLPAADADAEAAAGNPAVALFVDRAQAAGAAWADDARDLPAICALVRLLDGQPLALELAASRARTLAPAQLLQLLDEGAGAHLALLTRHGPRAGHDPRHASIAAVIDWSWQLLDAAAQRLLAALSCCAGGAGIAMLAGMTAEAPGAVAARLDELAAHSLLRVMAGPGDAPPRYDLIESVREFVRSRWPAPARAQLQQALQQWLLRWAQALGPNPRQAMVEAELRNVYAVLAEPVEPLHDALQLALALRPPQWDSAGMPAGVQDALERALQSHRAAAGAASEPLASEVHELLAYVRFEAGFVAEAQAHAEAAVQLAGADGRRRARALVRLAWVELAAAHGGDDAGPRAAHLREVLQDALALGRAAGDVEAQARALHQLAVLASQLQGDWVAAEALNAESQALWLRLGDRRKAAARLRNRGQCWRQLGRIDEARRCFEDCERAAREEGDVVGQIDSQLSLSTLLVAGRQWRQALAVDRRCIALCWRHWHRHGLAYALWNPPRSLARLHRPEPAMRLMAFAANFWASNFGPLARTDRQTVQRVRALVRAQRGAARAEAWWVEGASMDLAAAVELALTPWEDLPDPA